MSKLQFDSKTNSPCLYLLRKILFKCLSNSGKQTCILSISGPPASGKTTLAQKIITFLSYTNTPYIYTRLTGFHNISYLYAILVLGLYSFMMNKKYSFYITKAYKILPYDLLPKNLIRRMQHVIYILEILSLYIKLLIMLFTFLIRRPKVTIIDEGFINTAFNYITFFESRGLNYWKLLIKHLSIVLQRLLMEHKLTYIVLMLDINDAIERWRNRGDLPSHRRARYHIISYTRLLPLILRFFKNYNNDIVFCGEVYNG